MHKIGGFMQVNSVFFRVEIASVAVQYLKKIFKYGN